ncbi:hypothetical protein ACFFWD_23240 [Bradyrhizobium erythrophlei]|uniref:hypothetical protein n=1 Tax=Bradyrhizobium erythrophlei TaxID=1437360 RepID=UPI0035E7FEDB
MRTPATHAPTLLEVKGLQKLFPVTEGVLARRAVGEVRAVDGVDFTLRRGEVGLSRMPMARNRRVTTLP